MKGAGLAILALVAVGVVAAGAIAASHSGLAANVSDALKLLAAKLGVPSNDTSNTTATPAPPVTTHAGSPTSPSGGGGDVRVCWTAGGWLEAGTQEPPLWLQRLTVKLDGRTIYDYFTSGNGLMKSACTYVSAGRHTMVATYSTINSGLYVRKAWLGVDTRPHLSANGLPYPTLYRVHRMYYNYPPDFSVHRVTITITFDVSNSSVTEVHSEVSTG